MNWISVNERLPVDDNEFVLCVYAINIWPTSYGSSSKGIYTSVHYYPQIKKWGKWSNGDFLAVVGDVTHWHSWPEPPK